MPDKYSARDDDYISQVSNPPFHSELVSLDDGKVSNKQDTAPSLLTNESILWPGLAALTRRGV